MKKIFIFLLATLMILSATACGNDAEEELENGVVDEVEDGVESRTTTLEPVPTIIAAINANTFSSLRLDMSAYEVAQFLGSPTDEASTDMGDVEMVMQKWIGDNYNYISAMFISDALVSFSQFGLESVQEPYSLPISSGGINEESFAVIRNGMTLEDVVYIIGEEPFGGVVQGGAVVELEGLNTIMFSWSTTGDTVISISVFIEDGRVVSTSLMLLESL